MVRGILFDLDGTLVDSRQDIANSLNHTLGKMGRSGFDLETVTEFIGNGVGYLVLRALRHPEAVELGQENHLRPEEEPLMAQALDLFRRHYGEHCADASTLYPGTEEILERFSDRPLGVVTNKPEAPTHTILKAFGIDQRMAVVLGGDTLGVRKPSPLPLLEAAKRMAVSPEKMVMVGDSPGDIRAGQGAGMGTCAALYGYRPAHELHSARPDSTISQMVDLKEVIP